MQHHARDDRVHAFFVNSKTVRSYLIRKICAFVYVAIVRWVFELHNKGETLCIPLDSVIITLAAAKVSTGKAVPIADGLP